MRQRIKNVIYTALAFLFLGIGAVGVVVPVLPTTPLLLAAAFFFAKGSVRFHDWFLSTGLYKKHLESFAVNRAMTLKTKWCILLPASAMLILAFFICPIWHGQVFIVLVMIYKYYYFFAKIKTIRPETARLDAKVRQEGQG
ncbi:MAG TPA: YbaN family protein [Candidatus Caccomorpha excrementavium]|nr:YbaN family protein [Candidatus Caccomorpha excrementavium]